MLCGCSTAYRLRHYADYALRGCNVKVIHKERRTGKTAELIEIASSEGGYIVCHCHDEAYRISKVAEESGKPILFPLTYNEYLSGAFHGKNIKAFYIDNVDILFSTISKGVPVKAFTINKEEAEQLLQPDSTQ
jgi:hypothetical protein